MRFIRKWLVDWVLSDDEVFEIVIAHGVWSGFVCRDHRMIIRNSTGDILIDMGFHYASSYCSLVGPTLDIGGGFTLEVKER